MEPDPSPLETTRRATPSGDDRLIDSLRRWVRPVLAVAGPLTVVALAWSTADVTDASQVSLVALVLASVTVAVALTTSLGGITTSVAAALALNYFHTEPVRSLRIDDAGDVATVVVLGVLGLGVSTLTEHRVRQAGRDRRMDRAASARASLEVGTLRPVVDVWSDVVTACTADLALVDCRAATDADRELPHIALHRTVLDDSAHFVLPATGAIVEVPDPRVDTRLVVIPRQGAGSVDLDRRAVTAFADQVGIALTPLHT